MKTKITLISANVFSVMIYAQPGISLGTSGNSIGCAPHVVEFIPLK